MRSWAYLQHMWIWSVGLRCEFVWGVEHICGPSGALLRPAVSVWGPAEKPQRTFVHPVRPVVHPVRELGPPPVVHHLHSRHLFQTHQALIMTWLCALQYAAVYRGMVMLWLYRQQRHDMVAAIMPQSSKPFVLLARYNELRPKLRIWGASLGRKSVNWAEDGLASVLGLSTGRHLISTPVGLISCWPQCCTLIGWAVGQLRSDWLSRSGARAAVRVGG